MFNQLINIRFSYAIVLLYLSAGLLAACSKSGANPVDDDDDPPGNEPQLTYVYREGVGGYEVYRIPAIVKTKSGALLAFAEARKSKSSGDAGDIDLVVKKSTDNGKTWGSQVMVWDQGANTCGNPVPIVDETTGNIHLLMTWNKGDDTWGEITNGTSQDTRRVYYTSSNDEGATWSQAKEITQDIKRPWWQWYGTGPVHGIQLTTGAAKNRLVAPCYYTVQVNGQRKGFSHVIYSDDAGATWKAGDTTAVEQVGECTVAELSDGKLLLNMRQGTGYLRKYAISEDGGSTWKAVQTDYALSDPQCQASLLNTMIDGQHSLFFANAEGTERKNLTIKMSVNNGGQWTKRFTVHEGPAAYSDMVWTKDNTVGILYEGGNGRPYENIIFKKIATGDFK